MRLEGEEEDGKGVDGDESHRHPHDFYKYAPNQSARGSVPNSGKMSQAVGQLLEHTKTLWNRKEKRLYNLMLRKVRLEEAHMRMMRLLLDGDK